MIYFDERHPSEVALRATLDRALFLAILATGLSLGGALAHLYALPNKMAMPLDRYFTAQAIYAGWAQLAYVLAIQLVAILATIVLAREERGVRSAALAGLGCLVAAQIVFWIWTQPANLATSNWTVQPPDADALRRRWEYSHAVGALFQLGALAALALAALRRSR